jgi:2-methylcitrate dehydratase PrpD
MDEKRLITFVDIAPEPGGEQRLRRAMATAPKQRSWRHATWSVAAAAAAAVVITASLALQPPPYRDAIADAVAHATQPVDGLRLSEGSASRLPSAAPHVTIYLVEATGGNGQN